MLGLLADEAPALLEPRLEHAGLVGPPAPGHRALVDEDQLAFSASMSGRAARAAPQVERRVRNGVRTSAQWRGATASSSRPASSGGIHRRSVALAGRLQPGVGGIDACAQRGIDLDAVLAQRVAQHRGEAADRPVDRRLRQAEVEQRGVDVVQVLARDLVQRAIRATGQVRVDVLGDAVLVGLHGARVAPDARRPDAHPLAEREPAVEHLPLVERSDAFLGRTSRLGLGAVVAGAALAVVAVAVQRTPVGDLAVGVADGDRRDRSRDADVGAGTSVRSVIEGRRSSGRPGSAPLRLARSRSPSTRAYAPAVVPDESTW